eukprot:CAMPEP_0197282328 /NCGR_PEP_ID=MMETSP1432-20130617/23995_1 /TAXON_ID=44447 /ORGANISM="Pseudo-nitzschia delicatissima, Strain UNC1205" /LENGTH=73 /DNA_ID=CAMNT_0042749245 /DNA_START=79 /DNA_END=300 /DNA_ORIENTATION=-
MADQKNASFLYYLRSFLKQGDSCENDCGTPVNKRKDIEDISSSSFDNDMASSMMADDDVVLSQSSKRRRSDER